MAAIKAGKDICLANKETLIAGGPYVLPLAREHGVNILPADSEHSVRPGVPVGIQQSQLLGCCPLCATHRLAAWRTCSRCLPIPVMRNNSLVIYSMG